MVLFWFFIILQDEIQAVLWVKGFYLIILVHCFLNLTQGLCLVLEASCKDGGGILSPLIDNLLGGLHSMVRSQ